MHQEVCKSHRNPWCGAYSLTKLSTVDVVHLACQFPDGWGSKSVSLAGTLAMRCQVAPKHIARISAPMRREGQRKQPCSQAPTCMPKSWPFEVILLARMLERRQACIDMSKGRMGGKGGRGGGCDLRQQVALRAPQRPAVSSHQQLPRRVLPLAHAPCHRRQPISTWQLRSLAALLQIFPWLIRLSKRLFIAFACRRSD